MKKSYFLTLLGMVFGLSACVQGDMVQLAKPTNTVNDSEKVTALCRDGTTTSNQNLNSVCFGNGGAKKVAVYHHAE